MKHDLVRHGFKRAASGGMAGGLLLAGASVACGDIGENDYAERGLPLDTESEEQPAGALAIERLHELDLGGQQVTFDWIRNDTADDGTPLELEGAAAGFIGIGYASDGPNLLQALSKEHGALTSLEIFTAFAPPGFAPDPLLVEAHEGEARALGRTDLQPQLLNAAQVLVEKAIPPNCDDTIYTGIAPLTWISFEEQTVGVDNTNYFLCAGSPKVANLGNPTGCVRHDNRRAITVGLCVDTNSVEEASWTYFLNGVAPLNGFRAAPGQIRSILFNPQPPPPGPVLPTRSLAIRSRNGVADANRHRQEAGVSNM